MFRSWTRRNAQCVNCLNFDFKVFNYHPFYFFQIEMSEEQIAKLVEQVGDLKLNEELEELSGGQNKIVDSESIAIFQQWLVRRSSCPVNFEWEDLGEYFWPRWIRTGTCQNSEEYRKKKNGCSWPSGMHCIQGQVEMLQILRWHCRNRHNRSKNTKRRKCKWYKVPYPVTSSCKCACTNS